MRWGRFGAGLLAVALVTGAVPAAKTNPLVSPACGARLSGGHAKSGARLTLWRTTSVDGGVVLERQRWVSSEQASADSFQLSILPWADGGSWTLQERQQTVLQTQASDGGASATCVDSRVSVFRGPVNIDADHEPGAPAEVSRYHGVGRSKAETLQSCKITGLYAYAETDVLLASRGCVIELGFNDDMTRGGAVWEMPPPEGSHEEHTAVGGPTPRGL